ncbi:MAG: 1-(5-phosphoribosyl)-5-[(5-phosphoribosylamino)methylideneamino]imidazole-4-carboxamide isomerase [Francisellaceae bacterium]
MTIIPAIDLINGQCVRLKRGNFDEVTHYEPTPSEIARSSQQDGAKHLHIVDLDGAKSGKTQQFATIETIRRHCDLMIQVGGGISDISDMERLFNLGIDRVVIGSLAIKNPVLTRQALKRFGGDRMVLALDVRIKDDHAFVTTSGWQKTETLSLDTVLSFYQRDKIKHVLCTDIDRDGLLEGLNLDLYHHYQKRYGHISFQASGGVGSLLDLKRLKKIGVPAVIVGKALYEKRFTLKEALAC